MAAAIWGISRSTAAAISPSAALMTRNISVVERASISEDDGFAVSVSRSWRSTMLLNVEGAAAAAGGFYVRVAELEARAFERLDIVDFGAIEVQHAGLIYENLEFAETVSLVEHIWLIFEGHRIAEARAASTYHGDPQTGGLGF